MMKCQCQYENNFILKGCKDFIILCSQIRMSQQHVLTSKRIVVGMKTINLYQVGCNVKSEKAEKT